MRGSSAQLLLQRGRRALRGVPGRGPGHIECSSWRHQPALRCLPRTAVQGGDPDVKFAGLDIAELLDLTVDDALELFRQHADDQTACRRIVQKLEPLSNTGLGCVKLGQSSSTLSGGEAQRIKLSSYDQGPGRSPLFIFDEPTTGLHFHDIAKLLHAFEAPIMHRPQRAGDRARHG